MEKIAPQEENQMSEPTKEDLIQLCHRALGELADVKDIGVEIDEDLYEELKEVCGYKD